MELEQIESGMKIEGIVPSEPVTVLAGQWHGSEALEVTYRTTDNTLGQRVLFRKDETLIGVSRLGGRSFEASASDFLLASEVQRIKMAGFVDPMFAVSASDIQPLPHQIQAVYGDLLPRTPLRFLLADDPGAGKTIMAGLYIKELLLREDVRRCLIVAPGGLVEQWQDELYFKFGMHFDLLSNEVTQPNVRTNIFATSKLLIARMDQLARNGELQEKLKETEWDLIIVDEAHRMSAQYFGGELRKTKRFQLGEVLGDITRHLLLLTATPHSGVEENFQLFLTLLDRDRFVGKRTKPVGLDGIMRRRTKEDLLTLDGRRLFPDRIAETVPYELTSLEYDLYEDVTSYVREGMNRADKFGDKRRNTVGFALTVLQRRLASSPEAIYRSLVRRSERLQSKQHEILEGSHAMSEVSFDLDDLDLEELNASEAEKFEEELLDAATASQTVEELSAELSELADLTESARRVRDQGTDRKWAELSSILRDNVLATDSNGRPRKLIVFTEHRDTLDYLLQRIRCLIGRPGAVRVIHGGVKRSERRLITEEFASDPDFQILLATDAAGEGLNLQAAHLMVNYDLPWNPNRIEQRFGRIHRIGQVEVCRLWNLVASNTREGEVFLRLLDKLEQMRETYGGSVFDVLGEAFSETPLRSLLVDAIQYGELPEVRAKLYEVVDVNVTGGIKEILDKRAFAPGNTSEHDLLDVSSAMDEMHSRGLEASAIERTFVEAFRRLGGRLTRREHGRYEIVGVPTHVRASGDRPIPSGISRVAFDLSNVQPDGLPRAEYLVPGHPLFDAVMNAIADHVGSSLRHGTVLLSQELQEPRLLVGVVEEVVDATGATISKRFGYVLVDSDGNVDDAGQAPYLELLPALDCPSIESARRLPWLVDAESRARSWIIAHRLPDYLEEVRTKRADELIRARSLVSERLESEIFRLKSGSEAARERERAGEKVKESSDSLNRKAAELEVRLRNRIDLFEQQIFMSTKAPRLISVALVIPASNLEPGAMIN